MSILIKNIPPDVFHLHLEIFWFFFISQILLFFFVLIFCCRDIKCHVVKYFIETFVLISDGIFSSTFNVSLKNYKLVLIFFSRSQLKQAWHNIEYFFFGVSFGHWYHNSNWIRHDFISDEEDFHRMSISSLFC